MDESRRVTQAAMTIAEAIGRRDVDTIARSLAPGFVHRTPGAEARDAGTFVAAIEQIPGEIVFVRLESLEVDLCERGALVTGIQHARVRIDGNDIDDRRAFVDWFVQHDGDWRIRVAVDIPAASAVSDPV